MKFGVFDSDGMPQAFYDDTIHIQVPMGAVPITESQWQEFIDNANLRRWAGDHLVEITPTIDVEAERDRAEARIDAAAEACRGHWATPGAGQAAEYAQTEAEARAALAAPDPLDSADYPMLVAEQRSLASIGVTQTLRQIADTVIAIAMGWRAALAAVKTVRRMAKLKVAAVATPAQAQAVATAAEQGFAALAAVPDGEGMVTGLDAVVAAIVGRQHDQGSHMGGIVVRRR